MDTNDLGLVQNSLTGSSLASSADLFELVIAGRCWFSFIQDTAGSIGVRLAKLLLRPIVERILIESSCKSRLQCQTKYRFSVSGTAFLGHSTSKFVSLVAGRSIRSPRILRAKLGDWMATGGQACSRRTVQPCYQRSTSTTTTRSARTP